MKWFSDIKRPVSKNRTANRDIKIFLIAAGTVKEGAGSLKKRQIEVPAKEKKEKPKTALSDTVFGFYDYEKDGFKYEFSGV